MKTWKLVVLCTLLPLGLLVSAVYAWCAYGSFTEHPGLRGYAHHLYDLTAVEFGLYQMLVAIGFTVFALIFCIAAVMRKMSRMNRVFWWYCGFVLAFILMECWLETRFVPKG